MKRDFKAHPLMILSIIKPFLPLLLIPVLRGVIQYIKDGQVTQVLGAETLLVQLVGIFLDFIVTRGT